MDINQILDILNQIPAALLSSVLTAIVVWWLNRRKYKVTVDSTIVKSAGEIVAMYREMKDDLKKEIYAQDQRISELQEEIETQEKRIRCQDEKIGILIKQVNGHKRRATRSKEHVKLLARVVVVILNAASPHDKPLTIDDLINGMKITREDREFLNRIIDEVNGNNGH